MFAGTASTWQVLHLNRLLPYSVCVENNLINICIFCTDICISRLMVLRYWQWYRCCGCWYGCSRMLDGVGFLPHLALFANVGKAWEEQKLVLIWTLSSATKKKVLQHWPQMSDIRDFFIKTLDEAESGINQMMLKLMDKIKLVDPEVEAQLVSVSNFFLRHCTAK